MVVLFPTYTPRSLSGKEKAILLTQFEWMSESKAPGAAIAFRLRRPLSIHVCFRYECIKAKTEWQILATDPQISGDQSLEIEDSSGNWTLKEIPLKRNIFEKEDKIPLLRLPSSVVEKIEENRDQVQHDQAVTRELLAYYSQVPWATNWRMPIKSKIVSEYGAIRRPPGGVPYAHSGLDLRAAVGTPVYSTSDGTVIGTEPQVMSGNTIIIDHGMGVMSRYLHLSQFKVKKGTRVRAGQLIALSGATGRVEAPHLHWEIRIRGRPVEPKSTARLLARLAATE